MPAKSRKPGRSPPPRAKKQSPHVGWQPDVGRLMPAVEALLKERYLPRRHRHSGASLADVVADALATLSEAFTTERDTLPPAYLSRVDLRAAYLAYYLATGVATAMAVMRGAGLLPLLRAAAVAREGPLAVLDLAAGPATGALATALLVDRETPLSFTVQDTVPGVLRDGRHLIGTLRSDSAVTLRTGNLRDGRFVRAELPTQQDVILLLNALNEWSAPPRRRVGSGEEEARTDRGAELIAKLIDEKLAPGGVVVLVEPATRSGSQRLIGVREAFAGREDLTILAPCTGASECPYARASTTDWCHAEHPWQRPALVVACDRRLGHQRDRLKFSQLVLRKAPLVPAEASAGGARPYRVIGGPMRVEGTIRRYLCGPQGRVVWQGDREALPSGHPIHHVQRGALLQLAGEAARARSGRGDELVLTAQRDDGRSPREDPSGHPKGSPVSDAPERNHGSDDVPGRGPSAAAPARRDKSRGHDGPARRGRPR